ncbi:MAG: DNA polymerase III subunit alpha [Elusimicrobiales bacterium]|nr:DNA polymerase III subunit alpha [Elusimicrobiales bacterium]
MTQRFVHLHNHSEYSLLDGMLRITEIDGKPSKFLERVAKENGNGSSIAITDHGNMYGAVAFYTNATKVGLKPIIGVELYIAEIDRKDKNKESKQLVGHLTALVSNEEGYYNLVEMLSKAYLEGFYYYPRIDFELLEKYNNGIIFLSGCLQSLINQYILKDNLKKAIEIAEKFKNICGKDNFYIELMNHDIEDEKKVIKPLIEIANKLSLEVVATNDCHYEFKEDAFAHDIHLCISTNSKLEDKDRLKMETNEFYFKSSDEMIKLFTEIPQAIKNTLEIASRCNFKFEKGKIYLPNYEVPKEYIEKALGKKDDAQFLYLKDLCEKGLKEKLGNIPQEYKKRLDYELETIKNMGFSSYFLIVKDFIDYAHQNYIPVGPGRGSGAGCLVSYALNITKIDPIKNNLLFERFLNPGRKSMPDLDIDFSDSGREEVINYVREKYGKENVADIVTYGTIMAKTALKDVGRVLGFSASEMNKITKMIDNNMTLDEALSNIPEIKKIYNSSKEYKQLFDIAKKIEGLKRHTGVHAAGKVITEKPVYKYVPLAQREGIVTTQYDGETLTELGLLKIDFLGLRTLSVIQKSVNLIKNKNKEFDIDKIPFDDSKTYELLSEGKTTGIFQLESEGMKKLVKNLKPNVFSDLSALVALYRPGPIEAGMIDSYVNRKHGKEKITYDHPILEDVLKDTYGTIIYQEQVMEIAKRMAGFSPSEADDLRKAMGKKIPEEMEKLRDKFIKGAHEKGINQKLAAKIFEQMYKFAGYGFNKSHSVAYATIAYQTAYLKANYPLEFMISLLTSEIGHNAIGSDQKENKMITYLEEAKNMGFEILPPDVNKSFPEFTVEYINSKPYIRYALTAIKNIGVGVAEEIVKEREKNGLYKSFNDFIARNSSRQINKKVLESLAKSGAFDSIIEGDRITKRTKALNMSLNENSSILAMNIQSLFEITDEKKLTEHEILNNEKEVLGLYLSGNPLINANRIIKMISPIDIKDIIKGNITPNTEIKIVGIINGPIKTTTTKNKETMCKFNIEDLTESIDVTVFPKVYEICKNYIQSDKILIVKGKIKESQFSSKKYEIVADEILEIYDYIKTYSKSFIIYFEGKTLMAEEMKELKEIKKTLEHYSNSSKTKVYLVIKSINKHIYTIETSINVNVTQQFIKKIEEVVGRNSWKIT